MLSNMYVFFNLASSGFLELNQDSRTIKAMVESLLYTIPVDQYMLEIQGLIFGVNIEVIPIVEITPM